MELPGKIVGGGRVKLRWRPKSVFPTLRRLRQEDDESKARSVIPKETGSGRNWGKEKA